MTLYIPDFHAKTGPTLAAIPDRWWNCHSIYSDAGATNNIGSYYVVASAPNGVV